MPAFVGLGAPHWNSGARGALLGMTRGTTDAHIARAALEGVACSVHDLLEAMEADAGIERRGLRVDGGASASDLLMQMQADVLGTKVFRPAMLETTAFGAASAAAIAAGVFDSPADIGQHVSIEHEFEPAQDRERVDTALKRWRRAVHRARTLEED